MQTPENLSPNEESIKRDWDAGRKSIRQIAKDHEVSDAWVRKLAKKYGWAARPPCDASKPGARPAETAQELVVIAPKPADRPEPPRKRREDDGVSASIRKAAKTDSSVLAEDTLDVLARLRDELDAVTCKIGELETMIEEYTASDKDGRRYDALMKAVSLPVRILAAKNLSLALRTLQEASPGKKEQAQKAAATAGMDSLWGSDLDIGTVRAN